MNTDPFCQPTYLKVGDEVGGPRERGLPIKHLIGQEPKGPPVKLLTLLRTFRETRKSYAHNGKLQMT